MFGLDGAWVRLLRQAEGFIGTEVMCESPGEGRYRVRDFWNWHRGFEVFRERRSEDFARFDQKVAYELIERQEFVGAYYEAGGDDLVSA